MATAREHFASVMSMMADLQNRSDGELRLIAPVLAEVDDMLDDAIYNLDNPVEDPTVRRTDGP